MGRREKGPRLHPKKVNDQTWWIIKDGARRKSTGCLLDDVEGARAALARYLADSHMPPSDARHPSDLLVVELIAVYKRDKQTEVVRGDMLTYSIPKLVEFWDEDTLGDVKKSRCNEYVKWRCAQGVSDQTARRDLETLRAAINHYHETYGPLEAVPFVTMPTKSEPRQRWLTRNEAARLLRAAKSPHLRRFIIIGLYTGMRSQSILGLSWGPSLTSGWVDLDNGIIYRRGAISKRTKKNQNQRPSTIPTRLRAHLERWHRIDVEVGVPHVVHYQGTKVTKLRRSWDGARRRAGLGSDVIPHALRHTAPTWLLQKRVDLEEVAGYVGMTVETLQKVYWHHHPDFQGKVKNAF